MDNESRRQHSLETNFLLDEDNNAYPCEDYLEWAKKFGEMNRVVKQEIVGEFKVSTVFLGINHAYFGGPPLLFETMVFAKGGHVDDYQERYSTWAAALAGHEVAVSLVGACEGI